MGILEYCDSVVSAFGLRGCSFLDAQSIVEKTAPYQLHFDGFKIEFRVWIETVSTSLTIFHLKYETIEARYEAV
jgi:hypothetical protein